MRETTNDDVVAAIDNLAEVVDLMRREIVSKLSDVEAAVWDTMPA